MDKKKREKRKRSRSSRILPALLLFTTMASVASPVCFHNRGKMCVGANGVLHVAGSLLHSGNDVEVSQKGLTALKGDFWDDATGHVFTTDYSGAVTGTVEFCGTEAQTVTTDLPPYSSGNVGGATGKMDKTTMYVNFPDFKINNSSRVVVTPGMGISVNTLVFTNGNLRLKSDLGGNLDQDASLLVHKPVASYANGYMEIERNVVYNQGTLVGSSNNMKFFGFSAPISNMYLDYFTDHWVFDPRSNVYITERYAKFSPGLGYYVVVRGDKNTAAPGDYIADNLIINREHFLFNRSYYSDFSSGSWWSSIPATDKPRPQEVLNTADISPNGGLKVGDNYFGNPYTCALDVDALFSAWGASIEKKIWIWAGQAGNFLTITNDMSAIDGSQRIIPSQQMFVVEGKTANTAFKIPASARTHNAHRFLRAEEAKRNELLVEIRDLQLDNYARLAIGLRSWGKPEGDDESDARYMKSSDPEVPKIYAVTPSSTPGRQDTLSINSLPIDTKYTDFDFIPAQIESERRYMLRVTRQEGLETESAMLTDKQTNTELNLFECDTYEFTATINDAPNRFRIVFAATSTDENVPDMPQRHIYYAKQMLHITNNLESDIEKPVEVFSMAGVTLFRDKITQTGTNSYLLSLPEGAYIVRSGETAGKIVVSG
jgi:hypothetical protein